MTERGPGVGHQQAGRRKGKDERRGRESELVEEWNRSACSDRARGSGFTPDTLDTPGTCARPALRAASVGACSQATSVFRLALCVPAGSPASRLLQGTHRRMNHARVGRGV